MLQEWVREVGEVLGIDGDGAQDDLLDAARVVAHTVERRAAPLTTYLIGVAVGSGRCSVTEASRAVVALARARRGAGAGGDTAPGS